MTGKPDYRDYLSSLRESITVLHQQQTSSAGPDLISFAAYLEGVVAGVEKQLTADPQ